jgi:ring-1,2-phenylacetyl-CoA epoxidase subunit PaaE
MSLAQKTVTGERRRPEFHALTVREVGKETPEAASVAFAVPPHLADDYRFIQGQYLTLRAKVNGEELRRPYSLCVSPDAGELRVCVKKLHHGRFSTFVNEVLKAGDSIEVMGPMGRFHAPIEPGAAKSYLFMAGGSGITPVISNIRHILAHEPRAQVTLFYGNRRSRDIIFREGLADLKDRYIDRFGVFHVLSDEMTEVPLFSGLMTADKVTELAGRLIDVKSLDWAFICGPGPMMDGGRAALMGLGVVDERIRIESFGERPVAGAAPGGLAAKAAAPSASVEIIHHGVRKTILVPYGGKAILDAAHDENIDVPYACKGGVCCTCRARLVKGKVAMDVVYGLEPDEIAAGYILTCQSHPKSARLVVDYDG